MPMIIFIAWSFAVIVLASCDRSQRTTRGAPAPADDSYKPLARLDVALGKPAPDDWLAVHPEPGQTFEQYVASKPVRASTEGYKIYLQPVGVFTPEQTALCLHTKDYLQIFYGLDVVLLPAIDDSIVPDTARRSEQLLTGPILDHLEKTRPRNGLVMAITAKDLYPGNNFNFVFGQARLTKRVGVSSFYRYLERPIDSLSYKLCLERLIKTSSHEIGHMLSCQHCTHAVCVMNGSNGLWESDARPNRLCSVCYRKFQWNTGFVALSRQQQLVAYFQKQGMNKDYLLAKEDLAAIEKP